MVKVMVSPLLDTFLGSRSSRHGGGVEGVAAKGWGPARSCLRAQELTRDVCIA